MVSIEGILKKASDQEEKAQQLVTVDSKQIDLTYDLAHLAAFDPNILDLQSLKSEKREEYIKSLTRDNTQLVLNQIWNLETKRVDNVITAVLPKQAVYNLPRTKPIPKPKPPTKWELFARSKGITKKKKERMVWDEVTKQWRPRFGYRSIAQQKQENEWMIEVPDQANPNEDYFAKRSEERNERVAKNELQRLRNISRNLKLRLPGTSGILPNLDSNNKTDQLINAKNLTQKSNASMGKFFKIDSPKESTSRKTTGEKRKFESNFKSDLQDEKQKNIELMNKVLATQKRQSADRNAMEHQTNKTLKQMNKRLNIVSQQKRTNTDNEENGPKSNAKKGPKGNKTNKGIKKARLKQSKKVGNRKKGK
ncbi:ribosome biogenesis regulatory protein homolog [Dermatophagoides farinae]|uniref:ribosome biogenesis regulatory protein homolog n=1 Tax=Dermatophagoides farinae TaxID=6954 RepID=UPI003F628C25